MSNFVPRLRSSVLSLAFCALALSAATHAGAQTPAARGRLKTERFNGREVAAGQVLVKFRQSAAPHDVEQAKNAADVELDKKVGGRGVRLFRSRSKDAETLVREFSARPDVVYAEPNFVIRLTAAPDDPRFAEQWALRNSGTAGADIGAVPAWDVATGSRANVVAVVDTGIDYNHPDLAANVWSAPAAFTVDIAGQSITCAAGSHGFDALTNTCDPMDDHNHGTHVAGIAGASGNNGVGVSGVSQRASVMGLRFLDAQGTGTLEGAINAIEFAIRAKQVFGAGANVRVLSNSWGWNGEASQALLDQINAAAESDMLFVAGAGNTGADNDAAPFYPASYEAPSVVSVAATDSNNALAVASGWASNYGRTSVDLAAPGNLILSTVVGGSYDWFSGTSMATPHVSGAAALVLSRCSLDTAGLKSALLGNVDNVASLSAVTVTGGRLNVDKAIRACAAATPTPTASPTASPTPTSSPAPNSAPTVALTKPAGGTTFTAPASVTLGASASDADGVVSRVDFYAGTRLVGTSYAQPHTFTWGDVAAGTYSLTAVATDDRGAATTSAAVSISVNPSPAPTAGGTGTRGRLALWLDGAGTLGDSALTEVSGRVGVGTLNPVASLSLGGSTKPTPMTTNFQHYSPNWAVDQGLIGWNYYWNGSALVRQDTSFTAIRFAANPASSNANTSFFATMSNLAGVDQTVFTATLDPAGAFGVFNANHRLAVGAGNSSAFTPLSAVGVRGNMAVGAGYAQTAAPANGAIIEGKVGVGTATPQSALQVNGYIQLGLALGMPPAVDCDDAAEHGRMKVDAVNVKLYVCTSAGWKSAALQ